MARLFLITSFVLFSLAHGADKSFNIAARRDYAHSHHLRKRQYAIEATGLDRALYWFGNFSVGDSGPLSLLIDTGSSDILIDPGLYKPSKNELPYVNTKFAIEYEGVNKAGYGFENINGTALLDTVSIGNLSVKHQAIANITSFQFFDLRKPPTVALERSGIIGFGPKDGSQFMPPADPFFFSLCAEKAIDECRFGLAFGTNGTGQIVIGKLDTTLIDGDVVPVSEVDQQYVTVGDVTLDNKIISKNQTIIMDVGTNNIQGPLDLTRSIFESLGWSSKLRVSDQLGGKPDRVLTASFPCGKPPTLGFSFPTESQLKPGQKATIFNISPDVWDSAKHKSGNCTSILGGTNFLSNVTAHTTAWLVGQPFFAGHYIDFDATSHTISYANLKNPATGT